MFCRKKNHSRFFLLSIFSSSKIQGTFRSVGGMSSSMIYSGAAGTVYKYESRRGPQYRELKYNPNGNFSYFKPQHSKVKVDNEQINVATPSIIMEEDTVFYEFDEMQVSTHLSTEIECNWPNEGLGRDLKLNLISKNVDSFRQSYLSKKLVSGTHAI